MSVDAQMAELRAGAPDIAALVDDERLTLAAGLTELRQRQQKARQLSAGLAVGEADNVFSSLDRLGLGRRRWFWRWFWRVLPAKIDQEAAVAGVLLLHLIAVNLGRELGCTPLA